MSTSIWVSPTMRQTLVAMPVILMKLGIGMSIGFTSAFLYAIKDPNSDIHMDLSTSSWFGSSLFLSAIAGVVVGSITMARYGRRLSFLVTTIPGIIGPIIAYFSTDILTTFIGRVLYGFTAGSGPVTGVVAIGECASPQNRGMFLNIITLALNIGSLLVHLIGYYVHWRTLSLTIAIPFTLSFVVSYFWPESPSWLADQKQYEKSRQSFYWLRGENEEGTREIEKLIRAQQQKKIMTTFRENVREFVGKFKKKNFLKPLLVITVALIMQDTSGRHYFPAYAAQLIQEIGTGFSIIKFNLIIDVIIVITGLISAYLIRVIKVRTLLFWSGSAAVTVLLLTSLSLYLVKSEIISKEYSPISLVLFSLFFVLSTLGCACVPLILQGEIFPLEHRAVASLVAYIEIASFITITVKVFPYLIATCQLYGTLAIIACIMAIMLIYMYFIMPETKNKTLQDLEDFFTNGEFIDGDIVPTDDDDLEDKRLSV